MTPYELPDELHALGLASLLGALAVGVVIHDKEHRIVWANPQAARILLLSQGQLMGLEDGAVEWATMRLDGSPYASSMDHPVGRTLLTGQPVTGELIAIYTNQRLARWLRVDSSPIFLPHDGELPSYAVALFSEVDSDRPLAPTGVLETVSNAGTDLASGAYLQLDWSGVVRYASPEAERLFDVLPGTLNGNQLWELMPELQGSLIQSELTRALTSEQAVRFESPFPLPPRWVEVAAHPTDQGMALFMVDISERYDVIRERQRLAQRNQIILDALDAGLYGIDRDGCCTFINAAGASHLGYQEAELIGRNMHDLIHYKHPDGRPYPAGDCSILHAMSRGQVVRSSDEVLWRRDGTPIWVSYVASPVEGRDDETHLVVSFHDVSEDHYRRMGQDFLAEANSLLLPSLPPVESLQILADHLVPTLGDGCIIALHPTPVQSEAHVLGQARDEAHRQLVQQLLAPDGGGHALQQPIAEMLYLSELTDAALIPLASSDAQRTILRALEIRSLIALPMTIHQVQVGSLLLWRSAGRVPFGLFDLELAIELAYRVATAIENSQLFHESQRFRATLDATREAVAIVDPDSRRLIYANRGLAEQVGQDESRLVGSPILDLLPDFTPARLDELLGPLATLPGGGTIIETLVPHRDGSLIPVELTVQLVQTVGNLRRIVMIARDIRQRRQEEAAMRERAAQLARSNAELDQFAYVASHDLKAPLRGISNLSQWIEEDLGPLLTDETRYHMELLRKRVVRLEMLIDGLLQYSRIGRVRSNPEAVDVRELVTEIADLLAPSAGFAIRTLSPYPTLFVERVPLQQVLMNLIGNAIKHHDRDQGEITIQVLGRDRMVEFLVSDDGPGIPPQYHDKIFLIFQRLTTHDGVEGGGLGLALVKKQVEYNGGTISVESDGNRGTVFRFTWPKSQR